MREINNFFREGDEPEMSRDDSANSVVVVKIDGSGFAPEQIINSQMLSGIEALLDTPQIIKEFHSMLHPLTEMIHEHESRGIHNWMKSFLKIHCCRLQAVYSPITVKNFVTVYTAFNPCNRGNLLLRLQEKV